MPSGSSAFEGAEHAPVIAQALSDQGEAALSFGDLAWLSRRPFWKKLLPDGASSMSP